MAFDFTIRFGGMTGFIARHSRPAISHRLVAFVGKKGLGFRVAMSAFRLG